MRYVPVVNFSVHMITNIVLCSYLLWCRGLKDPEGAKRRMETKEKAAR